jgi:hypothetical protein
LSLPVQLPGKLVKPVVEVVALVFAGAPPDLLLVGEVRVDVYTEELLAEGRVDRVPVYVEGGGALRGERRAGEGGGA